MTILGKNDLKLYLGTRVAGTDENLAKPMIAAINASHKSIYLASQQLEEKEIVNALIEAKRRNCNIKVLLEADYLSENPGSSRPWTAAGENEINRKVFSALLRSSIPTRLDRDSTLFHSNFMVCDAETEHPVVIISSANMTPSCMRTHWNASVVISDSIAANSFKNEFDRMWKLSTSIEIIDSGSPPVTTVQKVDIKIIFGPRYQPEMEVMKQIAKAKSKIRFAMYTFSQTSGIDDVLAFAAQEAGIDVAGVFDEQSHNQRWVASHGLEKAGVRISWLGNKLQKMHHKLLTVDDKVAIIGTFNFSGAARFSHETILVIGSVNSDLPQQSIIVNGISKEIERLIATSN